MTIKSAYEELEKRIRKLKIPESDRNKILEGLRETEEEHRKVTNGLIESEAYNKILFRESWVAMVVSDPETGKFTDCNPAAAKLYGYSDYTEVIGKTPLDISAPFQYDGTDSSTAVLEHDRIALNKGHHVFLWKHRRSDGTIWDGEVSLFSFTYKQKRMLQFIVQDITERKKAQDALNKSNFFLSRSQKVGNIGSFVLNIPKDNPEAQTWESTPEMDRIFGIDAAYPRTGESWLALIVKRDEVAEYFKQQVFDTKKIFEKEYQIVRPSDGETRWIFGRGELEFDDQGNCIRMIGTVQDITDRKKTEKDRERLQERLRKAQRMESIATLAGGIAHQFNNALTIVTGNIELLEMDAPDDKKIDSYINDIKASASRMTQLTAQLLTYARGGKYQAQKISLSDFVRDTLPSTGHTTDPAIHIDTYLADDIFNIEADLTQMQMVLSVLLMNSVEAMDGKGRIQIDCRNEMVTEQIAEGFPGLRPGQYACMTVTDYGKGMDKETRDRAFEPFFTTKFQGRGLGLAGVYGFVKSHNGYTMVDSELGKGTTVKIYLPACEAFGEGEAMSNRID